MRTIKLTEAQFDYLRAIIAVHVCDMRDTADDKELGTRNRAFYVEEAYRAYALLELLERSKAE